MSEQHLFHKEVLQHFPNYDYNHPAGDRAVLCDFRNPKNQVGQQQRAFSIFWALRQCHALDLGLDLGSHKGLTPYCIHVDLFGSGAQHPFYGGEYRADVVWDASHLAPAFPEKNYPYITSNHSLEHMGTKPTSNDSEAVGIVCGWIRALRPGGILAMVVPDNDCFDVRKSDKDHTNAWGHSDFKRRVLDEVMQATGAELVEYDTFKNHFSFNVVLRRP